MKNFKALFVFGLLALLAFASVDTSAQIWGSKNVTDLAYFRVGDGDAGDTTEFSTTAEYGRFIYNGKKPFKVTELSAALQSGIGDDTLGVRFCWSDTIADATPTYLNSAAYPLSTATTTVESTGVSDVSFANTLVYPGQKCWMELTAVTTGRKPKELVVTISGYMTK